MPTLDCVGLSFILFFMIIYCNVNNVIFEVIYYGPASRLRHVCSPLSHNYAWNRGLRCAERPIGPRSAKCTVDYDVLDVAGAARLYQYWNLSVQKIYAQYVLYNYKHCCSFHTLRFLSNKFNDSRKLQQLYWLSPYQNVQFLSFVVGSNSIVQIKRLIWPSCKNPFI